MIAWVFLLLAAFSTAPYVLAAAAAPPGTAFIGFFWFKDDAYNYLSYARQAEDGAIAFRNRLVLEPHRAALVNAEWWLVGVTSRMLGRRPLLASRVFALGALLALVAGIAAWLGDAGVGPARLGPALLLVTLGGGSGIFGLLAGRPPERCLDLVTGLFPVVEILANPHFVAGTALLLWSLRAMRRAMEAPTLRAVLGATVLGTVLGLTRPYDFALLLAIRASVLAVTRPPRRWPEQAAPLALLLPVAGYLWWVFYRVPAFASLAAIGYARPPLADFALALAPSALVAAGAWAAWRRWRRVGAPVVPVSESRRAAVIDLCAWLAIAAAIVVASPLNFSLQFLVGIGVPLLALAAVPLASLPPAATLAAILVLGGTAAGALALIRGPNPAWHVPAERFAAAHALRERCRPGDVLLSPPDIGRYAAAFTSCTPLVSHAGAPGHAEREAAVRRFYEHPDPALGAAMAGRYCVSHLVLPAAAAIERHLEDAASYRAVAVVEEGPRALVVYSRAVRPTCGAR